MLTLPDKGLIIEAVVASTNATLKIVILTLLGVIATTQGVFSERGISDLGRLVYHISLPALVFSNILTEVTVERLLVLWKLPAVAVIHVTCGYVLGKVLNHVLRIKGLENKCVLLSCMFGNVGTLSIAVLGTLCAADPLASQVGAACNVRGIEYISFYLIAQNILIFTWAEKIVKDCYLPLCCEEEEGEGEERERVLDTEYHAIKDAPTVQPPTSSPPAPSPSPAPSTASTTGKRVAPPPPLEIANNNGTTNSNSNNRVSFEPGAGGEPQQHHHHHHHTSSHLHPSASFASIPGVIPVTTTTPTSFTRQPIRRHHSSAAILDEHTINSIMSRYPIDTVPAKPMPVDGFDDPLYQGTGGGGLPFAFTPRQRSESYSRRPSFSYSGDGHMSPPRSRSNSTTHYYGGGGGPSPSNMMAMVAEGSSSTTTGGAATEKDHLLNSNNNNKTEAEQQPPPSSSTTRTAMVVAYAIGAAQYYVMEFVWGFITLISRLANNPTVRAAMIAFLLGIFPPIKALFVGGSNPPLGSVLAAIQILGSAQVPCSMLMLSGSGTIRYLNSPAVKNGLSEVEQPKFTFSPAAVFAIIIGRVLLFPIIGLLLWWGFLEGGLLANVPVLSLVILLDSAVPTAQNIVMLVLVHGTPEHGQALAYVILWQYAISVPFLIFFVAIFLALIKDVYA